MSDMGPDRNTVKVRMSKKGTDPITRKSEEGRERGSCYSFFVDCRASLCLLVAIVFVDPGLCAPSGGVPGSICFLLLVLSFFSVLFRDRHVPAPHMGGASSRDWWDSRTVLPYHNSARINELKCHPRLPPCSYPSPLEVF